MNNLLCAQIEALLWVFSFNQYIPDNNKKEDLRGDGGGGGNGGGGSKPIRSLSFYMFLYLKLKI